MKSALLLAAVLLPCLAFLGCASSGPLPEDGALAKSPTVNNGFASNTQVEIVVVRARFVDDYERLFGEDLVDDYGVIPIAIKIGLKGEGSEHETLYANPAQMDFVLYLEDGTALQSMTPAQVAGSDSKLAKRLNAHALLEDDLPGFDKAGDRYVFFRLAPRKQFGLSSTHILHQVGHVSRALAIDRSLVSFKVTRAGKSLPIFVGISRVQHGAE